jgi:ribosomal protein S18 acetylase RimI-like enzyme
VAIRPFQPDDAPALVELSAACARSESDFVLNPLWESEKELFAEFDRFGIDPEEHLLVADAETGDEVVGLAGFLRQPRAGMAGMFCPIVGRNARRRGLGGELVRAALRRGQELGIKLATAAIGTRNRAGYSLLSAHGFRPVRQHFLMRCDAAPRPPAGPLQGPGAAPLAGLEFAPAKPDDAEAILAIYVACGFEDRSLEAMRAALADGRHHHAVARHAGEVVAFAEIETHWPKRVWVAYVGVTSKLRGRGVGSALVASTLEPLFAGGAESALLMLSPANRTALRAYEKVGFRRHRLVDVLEKSL